MRLAGVVLSVVLLGACGTEEATGPEALPEVDAPMTIQLSSDAFAEGGAIPEVHTCDGDDISPPLSWSGVPEETWGLGIVMVDADTPGEGTFVHWVLDAVPASEVGLAAGETVLEARAGVNDFGTTTYRGPCPPANTQHSYVFSIYAFGAPSELPAGATAAELLSAVRGQVLAQGQLTGTYTR